MGRRRPPPFVELQVASLDGAGRVEGRRLRARNALPGELVRVCLLRRRRGEWWGAADEVLAASPDRQAVPCPLFPRCGCCALQQLDAVALLAAKQARLPARGPPNGLTADLFCGIGDFSLPLARRGHRILGLEVGDGCLQRARSNA